MIAHSVYLTKQAKNDFKRIERCGNSSLHQKARELIRLLQERPNREPPALKRLTGDLKGLWARRLNDQHRIVYRIDSDHVVVIVSLWTHYHKK